MSVRLRLSLAFTLGASLLVALGGWLFVSRVSSTMLASVDTQLATAIGLSGRYVSSTAAGEQTARGPLPGEYVVQILDTSGQVTASSPDAGHRPLLNGSDLRRAAGGPIALTRSFEGEQVRIVAQPYQGRSGWVAVAAVSLESYDRSVGDVVTGVILAGILVVLVAGLGSSALARRALTPVERMRREVMALSERDDGSSIAVPATNDELAMLARTMNDILARLRGSLDRQRAFVADASHELRTPLAVLSAELELASRPGRTRGELLAAVASASEETARLNRLTEDLLLLARSDSDRAPLRLVEVDVTELLRRSARSAARRAAEARVRINVTAPDGIRVLADGDRLRRAVDNLVDNALRFAAQGTSVELRASHAGERLTVEVLDRGPGFPEDFLPVAFERFRRPSGDRDREQGGAGLGLAIVRAMAEAHGGSTVARNRHPNGAAVRIDIAARTASGSVDAAEAATEGSPSSERWEAEQPMPCEGDGELGHWPLRVESRGAQRGGVGR